MSRGRQEEYVAKEFDRVAKGYDESRIVKSFQRRAQILAIDIMHLVKGMRILDLGCGTGIGTIDIATRLGGTGKVIGLDLSEKMIERANRKLNGFTYNNVEFKIGSGSSLDYDNYFDYVLSTNAFHHFAKKEEIFFKVRQSLKYGGTFIVQDICNDYLLMRLLDLAGKFGERAHIGSSTSEELKRLFLSTGFMNIEMEKIQINWFWGIMIGKGDK
jgi:arsenite methyltransferase